jgi:hypothetical protein
VTDRAEWSSGNSDVADVREGKITAYETGQANITASYGGKTVTITVDVSVPRKLEADRELVSLRKGERAEIALTAHYADGSTEDVTKLAEWTSDNEDAVLVRDGMVSALDSGEAQVTARYGGKVAVVAVEVDAVARLEANPSRIAMQQGDTRQVTVTAVYPDGSTEDVTTRAEWSTDDEAVATVRNGVITAEDSGEAVVTARFGNKRVEIRVSIGALERLTPSHRIVILQKGEQQQIRLTAAYGDGTSEDVTSEAEWSVRSDRIAEVHNGLVTALDNGKTAVIARYEGETLEIPLEVAIAEKLVASEKAISLKTGETLQLTLTAVFSDGTTRDVTSKAEWSSRSFNVADVDDLHHKGLVTAAGYGKTTITAKYGGKSVSIRVEVDKLKYLQTNVKTLEMNAGQTGSIVLTATYIDGTESNVTSRAEWKSSNGMVADIKDGKVTAYTKGRTTITAKFAGKTAKVIVTVKSGSKKRGCLMPCSSAASATVLPAFFAFARSSLSRPSRSKIGLRSSGAFSLPLPFLSCGIGLSCALPNLYDGFSSR